MDNVYEILTKENFEWRNEFKHEMKLELIQLVLEYFTDIEHYEKCSKLKELVEIMENEDENFSETAATGSKNP
jgi:hypothetical protein